MSRAAGDPLTIASLAKQVPLAESLRLEGGRLVARAGVGVEMNPYCRRAVAQGVALARDTGGTCTVVTLGPPGAEDVLREAVAWGADAGLHACDAAFAGSDTLATARALAAVLRAAGPFDLVLLGRNSIDGETGQVGPELAELLDLPFASGVRRLQDRGPVWQLELEHDDGTQEVELALPAVLSVAERLCDPCKVDPAGRAAVSPARLTRVDAARLGPGTLGRGGQPDGGRGDAGHGARTRHARPRRSRRRAGGRGRARARPTRRLDGRPPARRLRRRVTTWTAGTGAPPGSSPSSPSPAVNGCPRSSSARRRASAARWAPPSTRCVRAAADAAPWGAVDTAALGAAGADLVLVLRGSGVAEDVADALDWLRPGDGAVGGARPEHRVRPRGGRAAPRPPRTRGWWAMPSHCRHATASSWRPSPPSPAPWWPTSPAAVRPRW